jgi:hypothetical protein
MKFVLIILCTFLISCTNEQNISNIDIISVEAFNTDNNKIEFCSDFKLSVSKAQEFFNKAEKISNLIMHNEFSYLPCYVKGKCTISGKKCFWEIRAGGTAQVKFNNKVITYGCKSCELF